MADIALAQTAVDELDTAAVSLRRAIRILNAAGLSELAGTVSALRTSVLTISNRLDEA